MNNYVITIGRELGSGGKHIGEIIGKKLNIPVYDRRLILLAAQESGFDPEIIKHADEVASKGIMSQLIRTLATPFTSYASLYDNSISNESLFKVQADIIQEKATTENCIIVGRCSDYILRNHPRHINIFVRANYNTRIQNLTKRYNIKRDEAIELIEKTDSIRSDYHNFYAETNWGDSRAYDLCINSSILGIEATAQVLLDFAKQALSI